MLHLFRFFGKICISKKLFKLFKWRKLDVLRLMCDEVAWLFNRLYWRGCVIIQYILHALLTRLHNNSIGSIDVVAWLRNYFIYIAGSTDEVAWLFNRLYWRCCVIIQYILQALLTRLHDYSIGSIDLVVWLSQYILQRTMRDYSKHINVRKVILWRQGQ